eukprot:1153294-Prymnesium_polylepis.1
MSRGSSSRSGTTRPCPPTAGKTCCRAARGGAPPTPTATPMPSARDSGCAGGAGDSAARERAGHSLTDARHISHDRMVSIEPQC